MRPPPTHPPFEGPEKKLVLLFASPSSSQGLRSLPSSAICAALEAAACTVLSISRNEHVDAYLLSESSMFVADDSLTIKTCGSTTLLYALPVLLDSSIKFGLNPIAVQYSRVEFCFPERQTFPHDSFDNEVAFLDQVLQRSGKPFHLGSADRGADWHLYTALLQDDLLLHPVPQTLEIFMFELHPSAMEHFFHEQSPQQMGRSGAVCHTTDVSGIRSLIDKDAVIDAFNFDPCGYSLNALLERAYYTIHVSPEPYASYVSFETTVNISHLAPLISSAVKVFRPARFTVAYLGAQGAHALRNNPKSPVNWHTLRKLLGDDFRLSSEPAHLHASTHSWACVASFAKYSELRNKPCLLPLSELMVPSALFADLRGRSDVCLAPSEESIVARAMLALKNRERIERPTFIIDLAHLARRATSVQQVLLPSIRARYAVRCNSDPLVLGVLHAVGCAFEAVSVAEVNLLRGVGVPADRIFFASPLVTAKVVERLAGFVGTIALFGPPPQSLSDALVKAGVGIEVRVAPGAAKEATSTCEIAIQFPGGLRSLALDVDVDICVMDESNAESAFREGIDTICEVLDILPKNVANEVSVSLGEALPGCGHSPLMESIGNVKRICSKLKNLWIDPGRWIVGRSACLVVTVIGRKASVAENGAFKENAGYNYYLSDGVYGAFSSLLMERSAHGLEPSIPMPIVLPRTISRRKSNGVTHIDKFIVSSDVSSDITSEEDFASDSSRAKHFGRFISTLFGPTCDALDRIWTGLLPQLAIGDMLLFRDMGAYAASAVSSFNGFAKSFDSCYIVDEDGDVGEESCSAKCH